MASAYVQVPQETVCEKKSCSDECCQRVDFEKMFFFFNLQKNENGEVFSGQLFLCIAGALKDRYVCWEDVLCGY